MINFLLMFCHKIVQCTIKTCCNQISEPKKCSIRGPLWVCCLVTVWSIEFAVSGGQRGYWFCKSNTERWGCAYLWLTSAICVRNGSKVYPVLSLPRSGTYTDWHWLATNYPASFLPWALLAQISIHNYTAQIDKMCIFKWNSQSSGCTLPFCTTNNSAARYFNKQEVGQYIIALKSQWNICLLPCRSTEVVESVAKPYSIRFRRPFLHSLGASRLASLIQIVIGCHKSCTATD